MVDFHAGRDLRYFVIVNSVVFGIALAGSLLFLREGGEFFARRLFSRARAAFLFIIIATLALYLLGIILRKRPFILYPAVVGTVLGGTLVATALLLPSLYFTAIDGLMEGLGQKIYSVLLSPSH